MLSGWSPDRFASVAARIRQPRLPVAVWTVTALEPPRYFEWRNATPGLQTVAGHRIDARGGHGSRVILTRGWGGPLAPIIRLLFGRLSSRYVEMEAEGLKRRCEAGRGARSPAPDPSGA